MRTAHLGDFTIWTGESGTRGGPEVSAKSLRNSSAGTNSFSELMQEMSHKGLGASAIVNEQQEVLGIFTDGDLRRLVEKGLDLRSLVAQDVMHTKPRTVNQNALAVEAAELMEQYKITSVLVINDAGQLSGALNTNDLMRAKVI